MIKKIASYVPKVKLFYLVLALFFISIIYFFTKKNTSYADQCLEVVTKIQEANVQRILQTPEVFIDRYSPLIDSLKSWENEITDTCKFWLASALQKRSDSGYARLGMENEGLNDYLYAISIFENMDATKFETQLAYLYNGVAIYFQNIFDFDKALFYGKKALGIFSKLAKDQPFYDRDLYNAIANVGITYYHIGDENKSLEYSQKALKARKEMMEYGPDAMKNANELLVANSYYGMSLAYKLKADQIDKKNALYFQNYDSVFYYIDKCTEILERSIDVSLYYVDNRETLIRLNHKAGNWMTEVYPKRNEKAEEYLNKAAEYFEVASPLDHTSNKILKSQIAANNQEWNKALDSVQSAFKYLVDGYEFKNYCENPPLILNKIFSKIGFIQVLIEKAKILNEQFEHDKKTSNLELSFQTHLLGIQLIDSLQQGLPYDFSSENVQAKYYKIFTMALQQAHQLLKITGDSKYLSSAFYLAEKSKSFTLKRSLKKNLLIQKLNPASTEKKLLIKEKDLLSKIRKFEKKYFSLENKATSEAQIFLDSINNYRGLHIDLQEQIKKNYPSLYQSQFDQEVVSLKSVQENLEDQSAYIQFVDAFEEMYILVVTNKKETTRFLKVNNKKELERQLKLCLGSLEKGKLDDYDESAFQLYNILLKKALSPLSDANIEKLILIPDGELRRLPFEILLEKRPDKSMGYYEFTYLLKKYSISYDFSITTRFQSTRNQKAKKYEHDIAGFTASYSGEKGSTNTIRGCSSERLVGAERTVDSIGEFFPKSYINKVTTKNDFYKNSKDAQVLYLGLHGCRDMDNPLFSNILFTKTDRINSAELYIMDIYNSEIAAEHIFLTACYSRSGQLKTGEGLISISRAFYYAGAKSIVTSLWQVSDRLVPELELSYLKYLLQDKLPKDKALQKAKLDYVKQMGRHPSVWANFILIGDGSPLQTNL